MLHKRVPQSIKEDRSLEGLRGRGAWVIIEKLMHRKWQRVLVVRLEEAVCSVTDCLTVRPHWYTLGGSRKAFLSAIERSRPLGIESLCLDNPAWICDGHSSKLLEDCWNEATGLRQRRGCSCLEPSCREKSYPTLLPVFTWN